MSLSDCFKHILKVCYRVVHAYFKHTKNFGIIARKEVQQQNIIAFRRSVRILGEFYNKARLCDGSPIQFLVNPLVEYLQMLLEAAELEDLELFTAQVLNPLFINFS